jgi:hypothetical protein
MKNSSVTGVKRIDISIFGLAPIEVGRITRVLRTEKAHLIGGLLHFQI